MGSRQPSSQNQSRARRSRAAQQNAVQVAKKNDRKFLFLVGFFLVVIGVWALTFVPPRTLILAAILLLSLVVGIVGIWLLVRGRAQVAPLPVSGTVDLRNLLRLSPSEFEDFVGDLLEAAGRCTHVQRVGGVRDQGVDLLAKDRFGRPFVVQCKRYQPARKVAAREMRDFLGARLYYRADKGMFVTTSVFTKSARETVAQFQRHISLLEGEMLVQLMQEHWEALPERWRQRLQKNS